MTVLFSSRMLQTTKIGAFKLTSKYISMDFYEQTDYSRYTFCLKTEINVKHTRMLLTDCFQSLPKGPDWHILSVYGYNLHLI